MKDMKINKMLEYNLDQIPEIISLLSTLLTKCRVITFTGPLGAGKTTLVQSLLRAQGITDVITSPTFTYVNVYKNEQGKIFYHFDLYRINSVEEFLALGFEEYLYAPDSWALIEWPAVITSLLNREVCNITLDYEHDHIEKRRIEIECIQNGDANER